MSGSDTLGMFAAVARDAGVSWITAEANALQARLAEGRFYVACVGQFKRGKSTLINALVGVDVLPTGVVPVTAVVTVLRYGEQLAARVRFVDRDWEECDPQSLATYVSDEQNPGNEKGVAAVEVFVSSPLLRSGMCFVDTPGIGSVSRANTEATRAFVPHIDAALVVLGADPPLTGDELALVRAFSESVHQIITVFNKSDRQSDGERAAAIAFTRRVLERDAGLSVGLIYQVSAIEQLRDKAPTRDWARLVECLETLARDSGADLVRVAQARETQALGDALLHELEEHRRALLEPLLESERRVAALKRAVADGERMLADLSHLLSAEQERLADRFAKERDHFLTEAVPQATAELRHAFEQEPDRGPSLRSQALALVPQVARRALERWRRQMDAHAQALYRQAEERFVALATAFEEQVGQVPGLDTLPRLRAHEGFRIRSGLCYTEMMHIAPVSPASWLHDILLPWRRRAAIEAAASRYLARLLDVNSARIKNDFVNRVAESRRSLEADIRRRLLNVAESAERGLESAREAQTAGENAIERRLRALDELKQRVTAATTAANSE